MFRKHIDKWKKERERIKEKSKTDGWEPNNVKKDIKFVIKEGYDSPSQTQLRVEFKKENFQNAMKKLNIKKEDGLIVTGAGFVGKLPRVLGRVGYKVVYSDLSSEFVEMAKKGKTLSKRGKEMPAKKLKAFQMDLTEPHIKDINVSAIMAFEPTPTLNYSGFRKIVGLNLGAKNGIILLKSGNFGKIKKGRFKSHFGGPEPYQYSMKSKEVKVGKQIEAIQFKITNKKEKEKYLKDREVYETHQRLLTYQEVAKELKLPLKEVIERTERFKKFVTIWNH